MKSRRPISKDRRLINSSAFRVYKVSGIQVFNICMDSASWVFKASCAIYVLSPAKTVLECMQCSCALYVWSQKYKFFRKSFRNNVNAKRKSKSTIKTLFL
ncbi:hypothetical protein RND81_05G109300 [Saponaria officinalis]|uniref:Uncharacterized protein n=1 Tax=Saponaria officinalis TaxID=3572 RepID=A0AAW1KUJ0_SAPOF